MPDEKLPFHESDDPIDVAAAQWLARRDRGLTAAEQDGYLQWLRDDPRHAAALARLERTWGALDRLAPEWRPAHSAQPNPDLLALPSAKPRLLVWQFAALTLAAAAAVAAGIFFLRTTTPTAPTSPAIATQGVNVIPLSERLTLEDGSIVELNRGSKIAPAFTPDTRLVRLLRGEAHFTVTKNPARPFVVEAGPVSVRAVGTAFDVLRAETSVEVLVTEGKVHVELPTVESPTAVEKGERAVVVTGAAAPVVTRVTPADIDRALDWEGVRLQFSELPLSKVVAEFNLRNRQQLAIGDAEAGRVRVSATNFRADNVEGFVRLLEQSPSFGVTAERRGDGTIVLRTAK